VTLRVALVCLLLTAPVAAQTVDGGNQIWLTDGTTPSAPMGKGPANCDTIDTNAAGVMSCGTDATGETATAIYYIAAADSPSTAGAHYICDGVADEAEMASAFNDCRTDNSPGCVVQLLPGTFVTSTNLGFGIAQDNTWLKGSGVDVTVIDCSGNPDIRGFVALGDGVAGSLDNIAVTDMTIDCSGKPSGLSFHEALIEDTQIGDRTNMLFANLKLRADSTPNGGIILNGGGNASNIVARNLDVEVLGNYAFNVRYAGTVSDVRLTDSLLVLLDGGVEVANAVAIYGGATGVVVANNIIKGDHANSHSPLACSPCADTVFANNVVYGSARTIEETPAGECGIEVEHKSGHGGDATVPSHVTVIGNVVTRANWGICIMERLTGDPPHQRPDWISVVNNTIVDTVNDCIYVDDADNVLLSGNLCDNPGDQIVGYSGTVTTQPLRHETGALVAGVFSVVPTATAPATCTAAQDIYTDTSGALCFCTSTNTWTNASGVGACT